MLITGVLCTHQCHKGNRKMLKRVQMKKTSMEIRVFSISVYLDSQHLPFSQCSGQSGKELEEPWRLKEAPAHTAVCVLALRDCCWEQLMHSAVATRPVLQTLLNRRPLLRDAGTPVGTKSFHLQSPGSICLVYIPILWIYSSIHTEWIIIICKPLAKFGSICTPTM